MEYHVQIDEDDASTKNNKFNINSSFRYIQSLRYLIDMGFDESLVEQAMLRSNNNFEIHEIITFLLNGSQEIDKIDNKSEKLFPYNNISEAKNSNIESDHEAVHNSLDYKDINQEYSKILTECPVCLMEKPKESFGNLQCGHKFCLECFNEYLHCIFQQGKLLKINCMEVKCKIQISTHDIRKNCLDISFTEKILRLQKTMKMNSDPKVIWCPEINCLKPNFISEVHEFKGSLRCSCGTKLCVICKKRDHEKKLFSFEDCEQQIERDYEIWARGKNVQLCPKCRFRVEKIDGCNHMTCTLCYYEWCWLCRQKYSSNHYKHFNFLGCPGLGSANNTSIQWPLWKIIIRRVSAFFLFFFEILFLIVGFPFYVSLVITSKWFLKPMIKKYGNLFGMEFRNAFITEIFHFILYFIMLCSTLIVFGISMAFIVIPAAFGILFSRRIRKFFFENDEEVEIE